MGARFFEKSTQALKNIPQKAWQKNENGGADNHC
jgi:hypothetical protein